MITQEAYNTLLLESTMEAIEQNLECSPQSVALNSRIDSPAVVATQVKYLARAKSKLPSYYRARCIIPPLAFEQASSEACAQHKPISGDSVLDLTCGLGVDSLYLSKRFKRVISLERDPMLSQITRENFRRLGIENIELLNCSAEEYLASCHDHFDWVYVDPDRRGAKGEKLVRLEDCSPNILSLREDIARVSDNLMVKNSPLFDIDEAFRLYSPARVEVISLQGECKEVLFSTAQSDELIATSLTLGLSVTLPREQVDNQPSLKPLDIETSQYTHLITPDVALQKARLACHVLRPVADIWSNNGYALACTPPTEPLLGRTEEIEKIVEYSPKQLKRELKGQNIEILKRDFPLSTAQIAAQLKISQGGTKRIAFTRIGGRQIAIFLK